MRKSAFGGAALACLLAGSAMAASPVSATLTGLPASGGYGVVNTGGYSYYTGPIAFTTTTAGNFTVFCTDLNHDVWVGGTFDYIFAPLTENGLGQAISQSVSNEIGQIASLYKNQTGDWAIAAQAAIWQLAYPGIAQTFSDAAVKADYNAILVATYGNTGGYAVALVPYGGSWPDGGPQEMVYGVPEPSTWAMMMLGFAGLGLAGRRRRARDLA
jgi:hypothetical protein